MKFLTWLDWLDQVRFVPIDSDRAPEIALNWLAKT